jgi:hypothetical protein
MEQVPAGILPGDVRLPLSRQDSQRVLSALQKQDRMRRLAEARRVIESAEASSQTKPQRK